MRVKNQTADEGGKEKETIADGNLLEQMKASESEQKEEVSSNIKEDNNPLTRSIDKKTTSDMNNLKQGRFLGGNLEKTQEEKEKKKDDAKSRKVENGENGKKEKKKEMQEVEEEEKKKRVKNETNDKGAKDEKGDEKSNDALSGGNNNERRNAKDKNVAILFKANEYSYSNSNSSHSIQSHGMHAYEPKPKPQPRPNFRPKPEPTAEVLTVNFDKVSNGRPVVMRKQQFSNGS